MQAATSQGRSSISLRGQLLWGLLAPLLLFVLIDTLSLYRQALDAVNVAYDRTLLASAKSIGELLDIEGEGPQAQIRAKVPYSALEAFEADNRSRMMYRISDAQGAWIDGAEDMPPWTGKIPDQGPYAALVDFYDSEFRGDAVRVAVLLQPVATGRERTMAMVQVGETLELRRTLARQILVETLQRQALLIAVIVGVVLVVVQRVTRPVRSLSQTLDGRTEDDLTPIDARGLPQELWPLTEATNRVMGRLQHLLEHQKRFVRDAAHQLRTPLAVLKVQVQSARRGDLPASDALREMESTVDRATGLANQMLALAKVEQLRQQQDFGVMDWSETIRSLALELSPLIARKNLDFSLEAPPCMVSAHEWMLRELVRNVLDNAIRFSPEAGCLALSLELQAGLARLCISDNGPGISAALRQHLFEPFSSADVRSGSGLGLTIAREIALALNGSIQLENRLSPQAHDDSASASMASVVGLDVFITLPLAASPA